MKANLKKFIKSLKKYQRIVKVIKTSVSSKKFQKFVNFIRKTTNLARKFQQLFQASYKMQMTKQ